VCVILVFTHSDAHANNSNHARTARYIHHCQMEKLAGDASVSALAEALFVTFTDGHLRTALCVGLARVALSQSHKGGMHACVCVCLYRPYALLPKRASAHSCVCAGLACIYSGIKLWRYVYMCLSGQIRGFFCTLLP